MKLTPEEILELKVAQAYQVIGVLLAGKDGKSSDFHSPEGQRALDYFAHDRYEDEFLPFRHPASA